MRAIHYCLLIFLLNISVQYANAACLVGGVDTQLCETREILYQTEEGVLLGTKAVELGNPAKIYEYLRNNSEYTPYHGARSNSINSFLSLRGNDVDLASTLIAMFRSQGIKSRYAVGTIKLKKTELANWLGVINNDLAVSILRDQGIQNVDGSAPDFVTFEHIWVEALIDYSNYRGGNSSASAACAIEGGSCQWISLDPSFKQKTYGQIHTMLLRNLNFDYDAYYNAQNPTSPNYVAGIENKSPLEIFEEQSLAYLRQNHPGVTLEDVIDAGEVIKDESGILPASLPYEVIGSVTRYDSVQAYDDDLANTHDWSKFVRTQVYLSECPGEFSGILPSYTANVADLSTKRLTVTLFDLGGGLKFGHRLDGQQAGGTLTLIGGSITFNCSNGASVSVQNGTPIDLELEIDVEPGEPAQQVNYNNLTVGGYYLIASGGETSNWSQVERAYEELLQADQQHPIVFNATETGCDALTGTGCTPYVDRNANGYDVNDTALINDLAAQDDLTGGLLYVAQSLYYTRLREEAERYSRLKGIISPVSAYLGVVSTVDEVEYLDNVPFAVTPGGLLIDLKGIRLNGSWEIDQPETYSNETFQFLGHIGSSLEHEVWQEITGYDAISTVRGIQFASEQGKSLLDINATLNTFPTEVYNLGFVNSAPAGFNRNDWSLFGRNLVTWDYTGGDPNAAFNVFRPDITGMSLTDPQTFKTNYQADNGIDSAIESYDTLENDLLALIPTENDLNSGILSHTDSTNYPSFDVISTSSGTLGFSVSSARVNSTVYDFTVTETQQNADGTYSIPIDARLSPTNNRFNLTLSGTSGLILNDVTIKSSNGNFSVVSFSNSGGSVTVVMRPNGSNSDGLKNITLTYWFSGFLPFDAAYSGIELYSNRFVSFNGSWITVNNFVIDDEPTITCNSTSHEALPSLLLPIVEGCFNDAIVTPNQDFIAFLDKDLGFDPASYAFRSNLLNIDEYELDFIINNVRNDMYLQPNASVQYLIPERMAEDTNYVFSTYLRNVFDLDGNLAQSTYAIANFSNRLPAGGGYVTAEETIDPASNIEDFNNEVFTDLNNIGRANNDLIVTPSTVDPVSTVTGNMYHDETDIVIKGRGLDYALTRTYNSENAENDGPFGLGWSHSYGMKLVANDYGQYPNDATDPDNTDGISSSITYTDERGGDHNYLIEDISGAWVVTPPFGNYDQLTLDSTTSYTLTFRNGVKYIFEGTDLIVPGNTARLKQIQDPYGNALDFAYDSEGRLSTVVDNLGVAGRTGLTFNYTGTDQHIQSITDWESRSWQYGYGINGNRLTSYTNPLTDVWAYTYHGDSALLNQITHPQDRNGQQKSMAFSYYENGQAYDYIDTLAQAESLTYDLFRKSTRITNPRGFITEHLYDKNGALVKLEEPDGGILLFKNNADGLRYSKTNALGYETRYSYQTDRSDETDATNASANFGRVSREIDPLNQIIDYNYGVYDQPTLVTDKRGNTIERVYYAITDIPTGAVAGKLREVIIQQLGTDTNVKLESYTYYADSTQSNFGQIKQRIEYIDPANPSRQRITDYTYETNGINLANQIISGSVTGGSITNTYTYDNLGRITSNTTSRRTSATDSTLINLTTSYEYDALDRVTKTTNPRGDISEMVYDKNGQVKEEKVHYKTSLARDNCTAKVIDTVDYQTCTYAIHDYDAADRRIATTDILGNTTSFEYDAIGNLVSQTDANQNTVRYEYDEKNRRTAIVNANGHRSEFDYDLAGRLLKTTDANGNSVNNEYDQLGRLKKVITQAGRETQFEYDANGNQTYVLDAEAIANPTLHPRNSDGYSVSNQYDELNRATLSRNALNGTTQTTYDLLGNITSITDAEGQLATFIYDDLGRLIESQDPLIETGIDKTDRVLLYDEMGNVLLTEDRSGRQRRHTYDNLNRLTKTEYLPDGVTIDDTDNYVFNDFGDLTSIANDEVTYTYTYSSRHKMLSKTDSRLSKSLSWTYDAVGNVDTKTNYEGDITTFQYDSSNRLVAMQNPAFLQVSYHYDGAGRLMDRILSNGARTHYAYDEDNRLVRLQNIAADGSLVEDLTYQMDNMANITQIMHSVNSKTVDYDYDALYRLIGVDSTTNTEDRAYTYDGVGNRLTVTEDTTTYYYCYHSLETDCGSVLHQPAANRLYYVYTGSLGGSLHRQFNYDDNGRILQKQDGIGTPIYSLTYNGKGRAELIDNIVFHYDANDYRIKKDSKLYHLEAKHLEATYDAAGVLHDKYLRGAVVDEIVNAYEYGNANINLTYHRDHLNSVTNITGHAGTNEESWVYDAFGAVIENPNSANTENDLTYTGRNYDTETGLYYYRARYYDPEIGRFLTEDPIGFASGDVNFYAYVNNNPLNFTDPSGNVICGGVCVAVGVGVVASVATGGTIRGGVAAATGGDITSAILDPVGIAIDAGLGVLGGTIGQLTKMKQVINLPSFSKGQLGEQIVRQKLGNSIVAEQVTTRAAGAKPRIDFIVDGGGGALKGVEAKFGKAPFTAPQNTAFPAINAGEAGLLTGKNAIGAGIDGFTVNSVQTIRVSPLLDVPANLKGIAGGSAAASSVFNSASGGFVLYPSKLNRNMMQRVYSK